MLQYTIICAYKPVIPMLERHLALIIH